MDTQYWKDQQTILIDNCSKSQVSLDHYEYYVKQLLEYLRSPLWNDFSKPNIAESFGLMIICISCAQYDMKTVQNNPPVERMVFSTLEDALSAIERSLHSVKYYPDDLHNWRFIWRSLWVATFKSLISENNIKDCFNMESILENRMSNNSSVHSNTSAIVYSLRQTGHDWDFIAQTVNMDTNAVKDVYIQYIENN